MATREENLARIQQLQSVLSSRSGGGTSPASTSSLGSQNNSPTISNVEGEIPFIDRAATSFASNDESKIGYLKNKYPGLLAAKVDGSDVVKIPGENLYRYVNEPGPSMGDIASLAGDVPGVALGTLGALGGGIPGAIAGGAGGEVARKTIGRGLLGIPEKAVSAQDVGDVALSGALGGVGEFAAPYIGKAIGKVFGKNVAPAAAQETAPLLKESEQEIARNPLIKTANNLKSPENLQELRARGESAKYQGMTEMPQKKVIQDAVSRLPDLQFKPTNLHYAMMDDKGAYDLGRALKTVPDEVGNLITNDDVAMKKELTSKYRDTIKSLTPDELSQSPYDAGEKIISSYKDAYQSQKDALGPVFQEFKDLPINKNWNTQMLKQKLTTEMPELSAMVDLNPDTGKFIFKPFDASSGMTKESYGLIKDALTSIGSKDQGFKEMQNIREYLRKAASDPINPEKYRDVFKFRKLMLDHLEDAVGAFSGKPRVRDAFQKYAINENNLSNLESIFGGDVSNSVNQLRNAKPEAVLDKVFANSNTVQVAKQVLGPETMDHLTAEYLNQAANKATRLDQVSSAKLYNQLLNKKELLRQAIGPAKKQTLQRLEDLLTVMRGVPDMPSINPSGTAETLNKVGFLTSPSSYNPVALAGKAIKGTVNYLSNRSEKNAAKETIDNILSGAEARLPKPPLLNSQQKRVVGKGLLQGGATLGKDKLTEERR